jgi:hypothetical protein
MPLLPNTVQSFLSNIYVRILRFIGGLCVLLVFTKTYLIFPNFLRWIILILSLLQMMQMFIIIIIKVIYSIYTLIFNKHKFEVRNSPLSPFATQLARVIYCFKVSCAVTGGGAVFVAGGAAYDQVLVEANRPKVFIPLIGGAYKSIFGELPSDFENKFFNLITPDSSIDKNDAKEKVTDMLNKYHNLNEKEKQDFISNLSSEVKELVKKK